LSKIIGHSNKILGKPPRYSSEQEEKASKTTTRHAQHEKAAAHVV